MTTSLDLGTLRPPLLVFGGPYGNLQATRAVRAEAERRGLRPDQVICTGDVVAYCGAPAETVALIRDWGIPVVQGNVEEQIGANAGDCGCGFEEGSACAVLSRDWYACCTAALDADVAGWMAARPFLIRFRMEGRRAVVIHAGAERNNQFVFGSTPADEKARQMDLLDADVVIAGHTGIPFTQTIGERVWLNAGVIGMPANDGTPDTWYAMIEQGADGALAVTHHRLAYDYAAAAADMRARGFPEAYATALETGLWPSLDVLLEQEWAMTGKRLEPEGGVITAGLETAST
jgi:predicted phosphodiesterase